ncbi:MAG TPA: beta-propeller fold lactonase family protein [Terracidiphilus sp.]|jgi:6-phosphogluconolactonase (cycloisomerase 2 family)|nr:beta-propeller fold lactonase family protein [Terracidiphilus sp.]
MTRTDRRFQILRVARKSKLAALATVLAFTGMAGISTLSLTAQAQSSGVVYTQTNGPNNAILVFNRAANGSLSLAATVPTGGVGSAAGVVSVGSQGSLALSRGGRWLFAANEGDNTISVLERTPAGLKLAGSVSSNGTLPVSITVSGNLLYVLNDGTAASAPNAQPANISGFYFDNDRGTLNPIPSSTRSLSTEFPTVPAAGPIAPDIQFDNTGSLLYVAETGTSLIDTYAINRDGTPGEDQLQNSNGLNPFDLAFDPRNNLIVTEIQETGATNPGSATSYQINREGTLDTVSGSVPDFQAAPCWLEITGDGQYAYAVNTGSSVISGYRVTARGELTLLGNGVTATTGPHPLDIAFTRDSRYLYNVSGAGTLVGFRINADGSLTSLGQVTTVPATSRGLVAQ